MREIVAVGPDPIWEQVFSSREWGKYPPEHVVRFVARNFYGLPNRAVVRLLEIGCGPGTNVSFMTREGFSTSGIDGSPTAIRKAGDRLARENLHADLRVGNIAYPALGRQLLRWRSGKRGLMPQREGLDSHRAR